jgi:penicillin V acylase-like amidase (Ntn superfamily)
MEARSRRLSDPHLRGWTRLPWVLVAAGLGLLAGDASACTTVCFTDRNSPVVAYNYDFHGSDGLVLVNPRGLAKTSVVESNPHAWTSRFASLTFNQFGRDHPMTGVNERGLVVAQMWLDEATYPPADGRPEISVLEWIQLQLDTAATVGEVLTSARAVRIRSRTPLHYLAADRAGHVAVIEFLNGELHARTGAELPVPVLTNSTYADSLAHLARYRGFGGDAELPPGRRSLDRFVRAAAGRSAASDGDPIARAFATLDSTRQEGWTRWSIVHELDGLRAHFRTESHQAIRRVDLATFALDCSQPVRMLDIDAQLDGEVGGRFEAYSTAANLDLIRRSFRRTPFLAQVGQARMEALARHPDSARCTLTGSSPR